MPSEFVEAVMKRFSGDPMLSIRVAIDAELQEVREVLDLFEEEWMTPHDYEHEIEFLPKDVECDQCELSKRARALIQRLRVDSGEREVKGSKNERHG
jgi:hypothetical protein